MLSPAQRRLVLAEVVGAAELETLAAPARSPGFADGLARMFDELTVSDEPAAVGRRLAGLGGGQRFDEIRALRAATSSGWRRWAAPTARGCGRAAAELVASRLDAWDGAPVLAYGFEDVTGVQLAALRALAGRGPVTVSLPYETGREAFAAVRPAMDALTAGAHELVELPPGDHVRLAGAAAPGALAVRRCATPARRRSRTARSCCSRRAACAASPTRSRPRRCG